MAHPRVRLNLAWLFIVLSTVMVFSILVKLGFWQLERAQYKANLQQTLNLRQSAATFSFSQIVELSKQEAVTGFKLATAVTPVSQDVFLLDNQVYQGRVGYLALQALQVDESKPWLLVELGFVPASLDRRQLPKITPIQNPSRLAGRVYQKQLNPMSFDLMAEPGWPKRVQNLNIAQLSALLKRPLANFVLQPNSVPNSDYPHPWQPIPLSSQKHQGYAVQWFSMAAVFSLIMGYLFFKKIKQRDNK
ncbi:SURF1 family protein [Shewanella sp. Isolate13]|uniref:SURF1 family protein n=1 Tax=Shewanella sp. Isolate13 TaxID=2908531 RepID=UPI001EFCF1EE|nr:SURF1 family protein [Shewanella sp. Isolate13]MCG9731644.1 SURF1 family protein [Shewanella sp. Isolate13]